VFGLHAAAYLLFYLGWEFQFRGFMQHGLRETMGDANAVLVQVLASVLLHIGKPATETYAAIAGGLFWGVLAFRTRSLLSGMLQHFLLGLSVDFFLCYHP
jgi:membrane protease YdiL (CAAX protease family)